MLRPAAFRIGFALELVSLFALSRLGDPGRHFGLLLILFALACLGFLIAFKHLLSQPTTLARIAIIAVLLRLPLLFTTPALSDDVWRYLHDGRAQRAGVSPYDLAPADPRTEAFRGPEHPRINHPELPTIYPPAAQLMFATSAFVRPGLFTWKLLLLGFDLAIVVLLWQLLQRHRKAYATLYAWHPLVIIEIAGNAHMEPVAIAPLLLALLLLERHRDLAAGLALGVSIAAKFLAAAYLPFLIDRNRWRVVVAALAAVALLFGAYAAASRASVLGSLGTFADTWRSNASAFTWLGMMLSDRTARRAAAAIAAGLIVVLAWRGTPRYSALLTITLVLLLLSPVVHPWYVIWLLPLCALADGQRWLVRAALVWSFTAMLAYAVLPSFRASGVWQIPTWAVWLEYVPVYLLVLVPVTAGVVSAWPTLRWSRSDKSRAT